MSNPYLAPQNGTIIMSLIPSFDNTRIAFLHKTDADLRKSYYLFRLMNNNRLVALGTRLTQWAINWHLPVGGIIKPTVYEHFCGGETLEDCLPVIEQLARFNIQTLLDYGVEAKESDADFDRTVQQQLAAIAYAKGNDTVEAISCKITGLAKFKLLEKYSLDANLSDKQQAAWVRVEQRLHTICKAAHDANVAVYFDAEESWIQPALDALINQLMETYNKQQAIVYNTIQLYRHDRLSYLKQCHAHAQQQQYLLAVKLVRGAYMEKERRRAAEKDYPSPIQATKQATDADYDQALAYCVQHVDSIAFCNASHNEASNMYLCELMQRYQLPNNHPHINFGQLYGMSDHLSFNLADAGYHVAKYLPYGPVADVMPYLMRRAQENTSVAGQMSRELKLLQKEMIRRKLRY